ncbi:MAG: chromosome segregation protein [Parasphingorhabdus sp.]|jgi:chromosome segregation protein
MRLKNLKVAGFKSFVDPTNIVVPANMVGIVGPNGCGKSNVIDAVRWVMGESSAKNLRGDAMTDVIFNGSVSRKPVGKASVELVFQNDGGKIPESFANFSEISIKRTLTRDGKSDYYINNTRARRKDIQDIFRGTGLGPRSYSIIEQGMVSRIIESKPEDLRSFVEEAAGISKYKDRRRETETRIRHTRENLERVDDIVQELEKQLRRLQRQSQIARRYKNLKEEEQAVQGQLFYMRREGLKELHQQQERNLAEREILLERTIAHQRSIEQLLETHRTEVSESQAAFSTVQAEFYELGAAISNIEQKIEHEKETRRQRQQDLERLTTELGKLDEETQEDQRQGAEIRADMQEVGMQREQFHSKLDEAIAMSEDKRQEAAIARQKSEELTQKAAMPARQVEVQKSVIVQGQQQSTQREQKLQRLIVEIQDIETQVATSRPDQLRSEVAAHSQVVEQTAENLRSTEESIRNIRVQLEDLRSQHDGIKSTQHGLAARHQSLKEIQASALGEDDEEFQAWIRQHNLQGEQQLATQIKVDENWRNAADAVMAPFLKSIVTSRPLQEMDLKNATEQELSLIAANSSGKRQTNPELLTHWIQSDTVDLENLLGSVKVSESAETAFATRDQLSAGEVFVTRDGLIIGRDWLKVPGSEVRSHGILAREEEIKELAERLVQIEQQAASLEIGIDELREQLSNFEQQRNQHNQKLTQVNRQHADMQNRLGQQEARFLQLNNRLQSMGNEQQELQLELEETDKRVAEAHNSLAIAEQEAADSQLKLAEMSAHRDQLRSESEQHQSSVESLRQVKFDIDTRWQVMQSNLTSVEAAANRLQSRRAGISRQMEQLSNMLIENDSPEHRFQSDLDELLSKKASVEAKMNASRQGIDKLEYEIRMGQQQQSESEKDVEIARDALSQQKLANQESRIHLENLEGQIESGGYDLTQVMESIPEEATMELWQKNLEVVANKISNIGPVNLVAIEEFEEQSERKNYLDKQQDDLNKSLETLESVMRKIDRETRTRFKQTFNELNQGFQAFFPKLFGGGTAILELTDDDYLTTGVTVMARPPGKRNSTIHLLSGGEKALTAVSLLFSLFKLNPAPFCLLDEVDAPLDDANVERYCETLRSLSKHTQLLVITHNKITMEASDMLIGVTMGEPGVSKMVAVDIEQAVQMVAQ